MNKKIKISEAEEIFTEDGVSISKRIMEGRTIVIVGISYAQEVEANRLKEKLRTYSMPVFKKVNNRLIQFGYAIPK